MCRHASFLLLALAGCARDLRFGDDARWLEAGVEPDAAIVPDEDGALPPPGGPEVKVAFAELGYSVEVNAQRYEVWVYLDLDTGTQVTENDTTWDVAFQRSNIATNGGVTGTGNVTVATIMSPFADVIAAPTEGYASDAADSDDDDTLPDYAFRLWYAYDVTTHVLTPASITYVVHTTAGAYVSLRIDGYYDRVGTSGSPSFHYRPLFP